MWRVSCDGAKFQAPPACEIYVMGAYVMGASFLTKQTVCLGLPQQWWRVPARAGRTERVKKTDVTLHCTPRGTGPPSIPRGTNSRVTPLHARTAQRIAQPPFFFASVFAGRSTARSASSNTVLRPCQPDQSE
jgi:hypothetical protein